MSPPLRLTAMPTRKASLLATALLLLSGCTAFFGGSNAEAYKEPPYVKDADIDAQAKKTNTAPPADASQSKPSDARKKQKQSDDQ